MPAASAAGRNRAATDDLRRASRGGSTNRGTSRCWQANSNSAANSLPPSTCRAATHFFGVDLDQVAGLLEGPEGRLAGGPGAVAQLASRSSGCGRPPKCDSAFFAPAALP